METILQLPLKLCSLLHVTAFRITYNKLHQYKFVYNANEYLEYGGLCLLDDYCCYSLLYSFFSLDYYKYNIPFFFLISNLMTT